MKIFILVVSMASLVSASLSFAAIPPSAKKSVKPPSSILRTAGAIHGGQAGLGFSLLGVKTQIAKTQKLERITVAIGNGALQKQIGAPGYFQIENSPELKRVVINFPQTMNTAFDEKSLQTQFAKSPFVKSSQLLFEAEGQTTSLVLHLKKPVSIRAIPVVGSKNQTAQLMVDLFDDRLLSSKPAKVLMTPKKVK